MTSDSTRARLRLRSSPLHPESAARPEGPMWPEGAAWPAGASWPPAEVVEGCQRAVLAIDGPSIGALGVTSCHRGDGRTTVATAAAIVESVVYARTAVLVELDLAQPALATRLGLDEGPGVAEIVHGDASINECIQWRGSLGVVVAGNADPDLTMLQLRLARSRLFKELEAECDVIVGDFPPLDSGAAVELSRDCRSLVLVVRAGVTSAADIHRASALVESTPALLLNRIAESGPSWISTLFGSER